MSGLVRHLLRFRVDLPSRCRGYTACARADEWRLPQTLWTAVRRLHGQGRPPSDAQLAKEDPTDLNPIKSGTSGWHFPYAKEGGKPALQGHAVSLINNSLTHSSPQ
eukprot:4034308-Pyramimonas_sp.AAC.1